MAEDLSCYLHSLVTASAACCEKKKTGKYKYPVRDMRKVGMESKERGGNSLSSALIIACGRSTQGTKSTQSEW